MKKGFNGRKLAEESGIHPVTISALLNKRRDPFEETANIIAKVLKCKIDDLGFDVIYGNKTKGENK